MMGAATMAWQTVVSSQRVRGWWAVCAAAGLSVAACSDTGPGGGGSSSIAPAIAKDGRLQVQVIAPEDRDTLLAMAVDDLRSALTTITGAAAAAGTAKPYAIHAVLDPSKSDQLGSQGYILQSGVVPDGRSGVTITAATQTGAAYGIYQVIYDLGVLFYHPEARFTPNASGRRLPWNYTGDPIIPRFSLRGFHEHTQHPIPMSDYYLRPGNDEYREAITRYLRWLARNRQNVATFHLLKTVDLDAWLPYIADIVTEADTLGIDMGVVVSFVDQQQNNYKLIEEESPDPADTQIRLRLNQLLEAGFRHITFQIGSSEFTKPADADVISWLSTATSHIRNQWPGVQAYAWIHITCDLESEEGKYFFHLPLAADADLGAWVHTTMFYTVDHPAPVYECESFEHQKDFMEEAMGDDSDEGSAAREQVWFPETAWWLGFDNNAPIILPVTGWSRAYDIQTGIAEYDVSGHVTFTTGREWTYWQYDHFVTQVTWNGNYSWSAYLDRLKEMYGSQGDAVVAALKSWTELQRKHFYEDNPSIFFYLAGELPQDEIGAQAGVYARPPKIPYAEVYKYSAADFNEWKSRDFDMLERMLGEYGELIAELPDYLGGGTEQQQKLYREVRIGFEVTHQRIAHAIALYQAVISARAGDEPEAREHLDQAKAITAEMQVRFSEMESIYRSPIEILAREKPESLTAYPYGYLADTTTGYFWERRDDQLEVFLDAVFNGEIEAWQTLPDVVYTAESGDVVLTEPDDPLAGPVITSFIPRFLFGLEATGGEELFALHVAEDANGNDDPDAGTEQVFAGVLESGTWTAESVIFSVVLRDNTSAVIGTLDIEDATVTLDVGAEGDPLPPVSAGEIAGTIASQVLVDTIMAVGGIDQEGASNLLKGVYGVAAEDPLPETLSMRFALTLTPPPEEE